MTQRIDLIDYSKTPPVTAAQFWFSPERGLTCNDDYWIPVLREEEGLPRDDREFFAALPQHFSGSYLRAQAAVEDATQGG